MPQQISLLNFLMTTIGRKYCSPRPSCSKPIFAPSDANHTSPSRKNGLAFSLWTSVFSLNHFAKSFHIPKGYHGELLSRRLDHFHKDFFGDVHLAAAPFQHFLLTALLL